MIEAIADLFVQRVPRARPGPVLLPATSLLVVDACGGARRVAMLTQQLEHSGPIRASYAELECVAAVRQDASFDQVWLFVDAESDLSYCGLYLRELGERFTGARVRLVGVGGVDLERCDLVLDEPMVGFGPPWRRRRAIVGGAELLRERLLAS